MTILWHVYDDGVGIREFHVFSFCLTQYWFGPWELDPEARAVTRGRQRQAKHIIR